MWGPKIRHRQFQIIVRNDDSYGCGCAWSMHSVALISSSCILEHTMMFFQIKVHLAKGVYWSRWQSLIVFVVGFLFLDG